MFFQPIKLTLDNHESNRKHFLRFLDYANFAPSAFHSKPWDFRIIGNQLSMYTQPRLESPNVEILKKLDIISGGVFLHFLATTIRYFGRNYQLHTIPSFEEPRLLAHVTLTGKKSADPTEVEQFDILRTPWEFISKQPDVPCAHDVAVSLEHVIQQEFDSDWVKTCTKCGTISMDAITMSEYDHFYDSFEPPCEESLYPEALIDYRPFIAKPITHLLLHSEQDNIISWLETGLKLGKILLILKKMGLAGMILPWEIEQEYIRDKLECLKSTHNKPQILIRVYPASNTKSYPPTHLADKMYL